ncbi:MAG: hypothetical protein IJK63_04955 [Oscillospiraceae bacterium]|nr:hypothetical protein [Oscillospiraceae bacterium]
MSMDREQFLNILEDSFTAYYDIEEQENPELPLVFRGDYRKREERYWLTKSIPIWGNETGEYAYVFSAERFTPELAEKCIAFALEDGLPRVKPHKEHQHTDIKAILIADHFDEETRKLVQKKSFTKNYHFSLWGFSNLLTAAVDLGERKAYPNKVGHDLEKFFRKLFDLRKEEG